MNNLIRQIRSGFFVLFGSGNNIKATAYVGNLVDAIIFQTERLEPGLKVFNYADKPDKTVLQIVTTIRDELGRKPTPPRFPLWLGMMAAIPFDVFSNLTGRNIPVSTARVKKLAQPTCVAANRIREAGFTQNIETEEGIRKMVRCFPGNEDPHNAS